MPPIATHADALVGALQEIYPILARHQPDLMEASVHHLMWTPAGVSAARQAHSRGTIERSSDDGIWAAMPGASAHTMLRLDPLRARITAHFEALCAALGERAPILSGPWLRLFVAVSPASSRHPTYAGPLVANVVAARLFGATPQLWTSGTIAPFGTRTSQLAEILSPLDAPTALYAFPKRNGPIPGADPLQASMLRMVLDDGLDGLPRIAQAAAMAESAQMLTNPASLGAWRRRMEDTTRA